MYVYLLIVTLITKLIYKILFENTENYNNVRANRFVYNIDKQPT